MVIDHVCENRGCVNVEHLQVTTRGRNVQLGAERATHCRSGKHEWTDDNTYIIPATGHRRCRACVKERNG